MLSKFIIAVLFAFIGCAVQSQTDKNSIVGVFQNGEVPLSLTNSSNQKETYILTKKKVYKLSHSQMELFYEGQTELYCLFANDSSLWIGADNGVIVIQLKNNKSSFFNVNSLVATYKVVTIFKNADDRVYIGTDAYGLYAYKEASYPEKISTMFPINKGVSTADSTIWVGTDVGLFRNRKNTWVRYNEEGVSNFEIPDNIVQNLIVDNKGLLWILMRNGLAVIETPQYFSKINKHEQHADGHDHLPSTEYLGRAQNTIYDVHYYKNHGYLFSTEMGLLYLPTHKDEEVVENFHHLNSDKVENKALLQMPDLTNINKTHGKILFIHEQGKYTYLICEKDIYKVSKKTLNMFFQ